MITCSFVLGQTKSITEKTSGMKKYDGYFNFYYDQGEEKIWLEIDKLDTEFLYLNSMPTGLGTGGMSRNSSGGSKVVKFIRMGKKVMLLQPNYSYRALSDDPAERLAVEDAFGRSIIWGFKIEIEEMGKLLVDATAFLMRDAQNTAASLQRSAGSDYKLDLTRSALYLSNTKNFPDNSEFETLLTFTSTGSGGNLRAVTPDPRAISLRQHHSFIKLPDGNYKPRKYDPRAAVGSISYLDFATPIDQSIIKRFSRRFRLEKKDPNAKISEPVKPIIYYIDRGTPEPIRSALIEGANWWNEAFEAIGYKNAFQAKLMPEGADPLDIRYNMVNWIHRQERGWSSGGGVTDPRTGEIIKGAVTLGSQRVRQDFLIAQALIGEYEKNKNNSSEFLKMALQRIKQLSCHEVGHTLGYGHNYAASVNDRASVMDYPHPLIKINKNGSLDLSDAYDVGVGEWDKVTVAYSYSDFSDGVDEDKALDKILNDAFSRGLLFLSGQDSRGTHPLTHTWDSGKNPVDELERVMKIRAIGLKTFSEKRIPFGAPMATLEEVLVPLYLFHRYQIEAASKMIGGVYYNHNLRGGVQKLPEIVKPKEQWRALDVLLTTIKPENLIIDKKILKLIPPRPPGYRQTRELFPGYTGAPFDPLAAAENIANMTLSFICNAERAARLIDFRSRDDKYPGLGDVLDKVISSTWKTTRNPGSYAEIQRTVDYVALNNLMRLAVNKSASPQVRAIAAFKLDELKNWLSEQKNLIEDQDQKAHYFSGSITIERFQTDPESFVVPPPISAPPGAPIGG